MANGVQNLIYRAMRRANITASGETPSSTARDDAFTNLNGILSSWSTEKLTCYNISHGSFTLASGTVAYTMGPGQTFSTTARPVRVTGAATVSGSFRQGMEVMSFDECRRRSTNPLGATVVLPALLGVDHGLPYLKLLVSPPPNGSTTIEIDYWEPITAFSAVTDDITMPPGFELALEFELAVMLQQEWLGAVDESLAGLAQRYKAAIVATNAEIEAANQPQTQAA